jgi:hypothetical protein
MLDIENNQSFLGACFHNHISNFVIKLTSRRQPMVSTIERKTFARLHAMDEIRFRGFYKVLFGSDSQL